MTSVLGMHNISVDMHNISPTCTTSPGCATPLPAGTPRRGDVGDVVHVVPKKFVEGTYLLSVIAKGTFPLRPVRATNAPSLTRTYPVHNMHNIPKTWHAPSLRVQMARVLTQEIPMTQLPPRVLGIDLSLTCTGLAGLGWTDTIKPHPKMRGTARMMFIRTTLLDRYLNGYDLVALEGPSYGSQAGQSGHHERAGLWWLVRCVLDARGHDVAVIPPATVKKYATGKGNASKADMVREVTRRFPWFDGGEDEADALWLAAMAADHLGHPLADMPAAHRKALQAVQWPDLAPRPAVAPYLPAAAAPEGITDITLPEQVA